MSETRQSRAWAGKAREGDALAAAKLLTKYYPGLWRRANARMSAALRAKSSPEDVLQQVFVAAFRQLDRFEDRGPDAFFNWVCTILDNELADADRALHRRKRDVDREVAAMRGGSESYWNLLDKLYAESPTPSQIVRRDEALGALLTCVSQLSDAQQTVIRLRFLEGRSVSEVAARLQKSPRTVVALTQSALAALREAMNQLGDFTRG